MKLIQVRKKLQRQIDKIDRQLGNGKKSVLRDFGGGAAAALTRMLIEPFGTLRSAMKGLLGLSERKKNKRAQSKNVTDRPQAVDSKPLTKAEQKQKQKQKDRREKADQVTKGVSEELDDVAKMFSTSMFMDSVFSVVLAKVEGMNTESTGDSMEEDMDGEGMVEDGGSGDVGGTADLENQILMSKVLKVI